jgi:hypothetical protein
MKSHARRQTSLTDLTTRDGWWLKRLSKLLGTRRGLGRGRLKPRLNGLRPQNPPARVAETYPRWERRRVESAQADFVAGRSEALQARLQSPAALACPHYC